MVNEFHIVTATHEHFSLQDLVQFTLPSSHSKSEPETIAELKEKHQFKECLYINTCNRVLYVFISDQRIDEYFLESFFPNVSHSLMSKLEIYQGGDAISHFFQVASSLRSMVVGEREILKQIKDAYQVQRKHKLTGDLIRLLMERTIQVAKKVYTETRIGEKPVSVVSLSVQKMLKAGLHPNSRLLIIGAGQTINLMAKYLIKNGITQVQVFNRTLENAQIIAERIGGSGHYIDHLLSEANDFDVLISCTGAQEPIITKNVFDQLTNGDSRKRILVDLAIPHDISDEVLNHSSSLSITIEDLTELARQNMSFRKQEMEKAQHIVTEQVQDFSHLLRRRIIEKMMSHLPSAVSDVKARAINEVFGKEIKDLDPKARETLLKVVDYMEKKCVSLPMKLAKEMV